MSHIIHFRVDDGTSKSTGPICQVIIWGSSELPPWEALCIVKTCTLHDQTSALVSGSWWLMFLTSTKSRNSQIVKITPQEISRGCSTRYDDVEKCLYLWFYNCMYSTTIFSIDFYTVFASAVFSSLLQKCAAHLLANLSDSNRISP